MSETKWTPGPWTARKMGNGQWFVLCESDYPVCRVSRWSKEGDAAEAHLIASSPRLYAALERCVQTFEPLLAEVELNPQDNPARIALAEAAAVLALARGESPDRDAHEEEP